MLTEQQKIKKKNKTQKMMSKLINKTSKFVVKDSNDESMIIKGYASVFGNLDSDMDVIHKGSFNRTIKAWGPEGKDRIKLVAQHDISRPVARITELKEDSNGLYMEAKFGTHRDGQDYYKMAAEGIINEFSVGFVPVQKEENEKGGYDITEIKLYEVSMVTVAANDEAVVTEVKELDPLKLVKQVEDEELKHKLEMEILKLMPDNTRKTDTQLVTEVTPDSTVETKSDIYEELLNLYKKD